MLTRILKSKKADAFLEYALLIGIVAVAFSAILPVYFKRGVQGRVKDLTDDLISTQQVADPYNKANPGAGDVIVSSSSTTKSRIDSKVNKQMLTGGATLVQGDDKRYITAQSSSQEVADTTIWGTGFTLYSDSPTVERDDESDYIDEDWRSVRDIAELEQIRDSYLEQAARIREGRGYDETESSALTDIFSNAINIINLAMTGDLELIDIVTEMGQTLSGDQDYLNGLSDRADDLEEEADLIQQRIDCLRADPNGDCRV